MKKVGLYIHFPFCVSKCKYCNFNSYANKNEFQIQYFQALIKEMKLYSSEEIEVDTIFIGGGTPSVMFDGCISTLMSEIRKNFHVLDNAEITIESNPNSITVSKVREWKECGINRVSVGLQTINTNSLKLIGRPHTKQDYINAIDIIKSFGINNINTDCLIGLPRQKLSNVKATLNLVSKLNCTHISVYSLILEEHTPLFDMVKNNEIKLPKEEKVLGMYKYAHEFLKSKGYERYEVSNFAKQGFECNHNLHTWQMHEYLGFGAGAHGFLGDIRYSNVCQIEEYIEKLNKNEKPLEYSEKIDNQEKFEETIMLGLRTKFGINLEQLKKEFGVDLLELKKSIINEFLSNNLIQIVNNHLIVTDEGLPVLNKIILELI